MVGIGVTASIVSSAGEFHTENYEDDSLESEVNNDEDDESAFSGDSGGDSDDLETHSHEEDDSASLEDPNQRDDTIQNLAKVENSFVRMWRTIMIFAMVLAGASMTTGTYLVLKNQQRNQTQRKVRLFWAETDETTTM
jgi:hypothetical protein